jgi:hypothetical protein
MEDLILNGILEFFGIDEKTGEFLYKFTDKLEDFSEDLKNEINMFFSQEVMQLWEYGFVDIDLTQDSPIVRLTPKAFDNQEINKLTTQNKLSLKEILRIISLEK